MFFLEFAAGDPGFVQPDDCCQLSIVERQLQLVACGASISERFSSFIQNDTGGLRELHQLSRKLLRILDRLGCLSFLSALASIWRMRSRVTENCWPTSSSVWSVFMPMPK